MAVPFSRLADIIEVSKKEMDDLGLFASILGHIGDGNFHESIMYNRQDKDEREKVETCVKNMVKRAIDMDGTCTGEHSVGWGKKESLLWEVGPETVGVMVRICFIGFRPCPRAQGHEFTQHYADHASPESYQALDRSPLDYVSRAYPLKQQEFVSGLRRRI